MLGTELGNIGHGRKALNQLLGVANDTISFIFAESWEEMLPIFEKYKPHGALFPDGGTGDDKRKTHGLCGVMLTRNGRACFCFGMPPVITASESGQDLERLGELSIDAVRRAFSFDIGKGRRIEYMTAKRFSEWYIQVAADQVYRPSISNTAYNDSLIDHIFR